jgi:hypothetical protein
MLDALLQFLPADIGTKDAIIVLLALCVLYFARQLIANNTAALKEVAQGLKNLTEKFHAVDKTLDNHELRLGQSENRIDHLEDVR